VIRLKTAKVIAFTLFICSKAYSQNLFTAANADDPAIQQILTSLEKEGYAAFQGGFVLCEHQYARIDSLQTLISNNTIDSLFHSKNGSLRAAAFILYAKRFNNKDSVLKKFDELVKQDYITFSLDCTDALTFSNIARFCYRVLTVNNFFYKPAFDLTKRDKNRLKSALAFYENVELKTIEP